MPSKNLEADLYESLEEDSHAYNDPEVARLTIHENEVVSKQGVDGLDIDVTQLEDGVDITIKLHEGVVISKPVHMCFGVLPEKGLQRILMNITIEKNAKIDILAHCTFPLALDVQHLMDAVIRLEEGAHYSYTERHIHSEEGGLSVKPKSKVHIGKNARFKTDFILKKGRVGNMEIDVEGHIDDGGLAEMNATVSGRGQDDIRIREVAFLEGRESRAVLTTKVAVRETAKAEVYNKITATGDQARGHVDCKEIVLDNGVASAIPIIDVQNPKAHVTHEAAVGSVDKKQLQTLMARGLDEDEASELIIQGLLS